MNIASLTGAPKQRFGAPVRARPESKGPMANRLRNHSAGISPREQWTFLALPLGLFTVFFLVPALLNLGLAFTNWSIYSPTITFNGFDNFETLIANGTLWRALRVTLVYALCVVLFTNLLGLAAALALEKSVPSNTPLRALIFVPVLLSPLAAGYVFQGILSSNGVLNQILSALTGTEWKTPWLGSTTWAIVVIAAIQAWKTFGMCALFYIAGLSTVPEEMKDAARIDGANAWQTFWSVRWPLIAPAATINVSLTLIAGLGTADYVLATTAGGPAGSTQVLNMLVFLQFGNGAFGQAASMTLVLFLIVLIIAVPLIIWMRRRELQG